MWSKTDPVASPKLYLDMLWQQSPNSPGAQDNHCCRPLQNYCQTIFQFVNSEPSSRYLSPFLAHTKPPKHSNTNQGMYMS